MDLRVAELRIYPVKSCAGISIAEAEVQPRGFRHDRRFLIVDEQGRFLTQREHPHMARIRTAIEGDRLRLDAPGLGSLHVPLDEKSPDWSVGRGGARVQIWDDTVDAVAVSEEADRWVREALGRPCSLVRMPLSTERAVDAKYAAPGDHVSFADAFPYLLTNTASLDDLNARLPAPIPMDRFRPNIVVEGATAFAEDAWRRVRVGAIEIAVVKPCARCPIPSVDQATGERGLNPLPVLATYRRDGNKILFGQNAIARGVGTLRVGDSVTVLARPD